MGQDRRLEFHDILEAIAIETLEVDHVYFQPPEGRELQYPCIVYERDDARTTHADNTVYTFKQRYQVTVIDHNPDSAAIDKLGSLILSAFSRHFATSGLNHDVFVIYH